MIKRMVLILLILVVATSLMAGCSSNNSAKYPTTSIRLIIQAAPGGLSDTVARGVGAELQKNLGVPVICSNKPGASGAVAMSYVQASNPDGYTIGYVPVELTMVKALGFATDIEPNAFDLIATANVSPATLTVNADSPWKTLKDFLDYAKANPGKVKVGNSGAGSIWDIAARTFGKAAGVTFNNVPFDGATPALAALMGKKIDAVPVSVMEVKSGVESGQLKVLAVLADQRSEYFPDVPSAKELGYDVNVAAWGGFAAPKNLPQDVKDVLYPAIEKAINSDSFKQLAKTRGFSVFFKNSADFNKFANDQFNFYMKAIPELGIK